MALSRQWARLSSWVGAGFVLVACATDVTSAPEATGRTSSAVWVNGGFETGAAGSVPAAPWAVTHFINPGITVQTPQTYAGLNLAAGGAGLTTEIAATDQPDPDLGAAASLRVCRFGAQCARVNFHSNTTYGHGQNVNVLAQTMTVAPGDVDPADGQIHVRFAVAPVLQNPAHPADEQPYYFVIATDLTKGTTLYSDFNLSGAAGLSWQKINGGTANEIDYTDWQLVDVSGAGGAIALGDSVQLQFIGAGCSLGGHFGELYVDGVGAVFPGISIEGTAPAQVNSGSTLTYTLSYTNGSGAAESGVVIDMNTPPGTTFASFTPPAGATCTTPAVGATGTIQCTFTGMLAAGAAGTMTVTVNVTAASGATITEGQYQIASSTEQPILGPPIITNVGCTADANCTTGQWCDETLKDCEATLANGTPIPTDPAHANPPLDGVCNVPAGTLVCTSKVCDTADNECGYKNGDGTCNAGNASVVCRSGVCDPDTKCGYANGDGPCTSGPTGNGGTVCRSGVCSTNGKCEPAGGCNVDADCAGGDWCDETSHTCTAKLPNGTLIPSDPPHMNPVLNATCTVGAASLVCTSAVCDTTDNKCGYLNGDGTCTPGATGNGGVVCRSGVCDPDTKCGYANGDGPCTPATAGTVCRSGVCSKNGECEPSGGCNVDADCTGGDWCNEKVHTCTPKLANGTAIPSDPTHTLPPLNGTCTVAAGTLVCVSAVCDTLDNECGYANGDGPCIPGTGGNGGVVCRSGTCSSNGTCEPMGGCNVDADCPTGNWCDETSHTCTPQEANGTKVPTDPAHTNPALDGTCSTAVGALTCVSGVCDTKDNECGYANGDGPCTVMNGPTVCRSGVCSKNGTCEPSGGCNTDADCAAGQWCNETAHTCEAQLANGVAIPIDTPHTNPTLNGTCTAMAGTLVCQSQVCDTKDNECGYENGDGPCTAGDGGSGAVVCRSGICAATGVNAGLCEACSVDGDCPTGQVCSTSNTCVTPGVDAGADASVDSGTEADSGASDSGSGDSSTAADAEPSGDATAEAGPDANVEAGVDASDSGAVEGGGCSTAGAFRERGGMPGVLLGGSSIFAVLAARRRRPRGQAQSRRVS
jgi:uncharacterized repeat protein (TIGR01451 family)